MNVEEAIANRRSCRRYNGTALYARDVAVLMDAAKATPSAGALRPVRIVLTCDPGQIAKLARAAGQQFIARAPVCFVIAADYQKMHPKYGRRGERYAILEAGHAAQNIALQATALGLGSVMVGAFKDRAVKEIMGITETPLYIIPVGHECPS